MTPVRLNKLHLVALLCLWVFTLLLLLKIVNKNGADYKHGIYDRMHKLKLDESGIAIENLDFLIRHAQSELPNVPFDFWMQFCAQSVKQGGDCHEYPYLLSLNFHNSYWQTFTNVNAKFQLYNAYYDRRDRLPNRQPVVRLLAMIDQKQATNIPPSYCRLWFENSVDSVIVPVKQYERIYPTYWQLSSSNYYPYMVNCATLPTSNNKIPRTISLARTSESEEILKNNLRIHFDEPIGSRPTAQSLKFAVCVKGLNFPHDDRSVRLIEWLELLRIFGVSKVLFYNFSVHANMSRVLSYYQGIGFVELTPFTLASGVPNFPNLQSAALVADQMQKRLNEFIPYNDCFYRNLYKFDYIALLDIDEMIVPKGNLSNWQGIALHVKKVGRATGAVLDEVNAGLCFLNTYFLDVNENTSTDDIPYYMHMLRHTMRSSKYSDKNTATKCFHSTATALTLHNHFPLTWLENSGPFIVGKHHAQLQHYRLRKKESNDESAEKQLVIDESLMRFKDELISKTQQVLVKLEFLE